MDDPVRGGTKAGGAFGHRVQHELQLGGRVRDDAQDPMCRDLLLLRLGQRVPKPFILVFKIFVRPCDSDSGGGRTAFTTELLRHGIRVLAPGTLHAALRSLIC